MSRGLNRAAGSSVGLDVRDGHGTHVLSLKQLDDGVTENEHDIYNICNIFSKVLSKAIFHQIPILN